MRLLDSDEDAYEFYDDTEFINNCIKFPVDVFGIINLWDGPRKGYKTLDTSIVGLWNNENYLRVTIDFNNTTNELDIQLYHHDGVHHLHIASEDLELDKLKAYINE